MSINSFSYFRAVFNPETFREVIHDAELALDGVQFDAIVATGYSGATFGAALSFAIGRPLVIVRKPKQSPMEHHSWNLIEGQCERLGTYLFVDDLVDSGATFKRVQAAMTKACKDSKCIGMYLYAMQGNYNVPKLHNGLNLIEETEELTNAANA